MQEVRTKEVNGYMHADVPVTKNNIQTYEKQQ